MKKPARTPVTDSEERFAWDAFAAALYGAGASVHSAAYWADQLLLERRRRFGPPQREHPTWEVENARRAKNKAARVRRAKARK